VPAQPDQLTSLSSSAARQRVVALETGAVGHVVGRDPQRLPLALTELAEPESCRLGVVAADVVDLALRAGAPEQAYSGVVEAGQRGHTDDPGQCVVGRNRTDQAVHTCWLRRTVGSPPRMSGQHVLVVVGGDGTSERQLTHGGMQAVGHRRPDQRDRRDVAGPPTLAGAEAGDVLRGAFGGQPPDLGQVRDRHTGLGEQLELLDDRGADRPWRLTAAGPRPGVVTNDPRDRGLTRRRHVGADRDDQVLVPEPLNRMTST
jgi:hypothetical protein